MTLTIHDVDQRSDEWLELRRGMVTASAIGLLITTKSRDPLEFECPDCGALVEWGCLHKKTKKAIAAVHAARTDLARAEPPILTLADGKTTQDLAALLAAERIAGIDPDGTFMTRDMWRGCAIEDPARDLYAQNYGVEVTECGFATLDLNDYSIGVSPDGLVGDDGGIEIKSPRHKSHLLNAVRGEVPDHHMAQIQTALLVFGRAWWDYVDYSPGMRMWVKRVTPDPAWFKAIHAAVAEFEKTVQQLVNDYTAAVADFPMTDALDLDTVELKLA